jgi:hypothetical protein
MRAAWSGPEHDPYVFQLWVCPDCAFAFDAVHTDPDGGYSCPACAELVLLDRLRALTDERDAASGSK